MLTGKYHLGWNAVSEHGVGIWNPRQIGVSMIDCRVPKQPWNPLISALGQSLEIVDDARSLYWTVTAEVKGNLRLLQSPPGKGVLFERANFFLEPNSVT